MESPVSDKINILLIDDKPENLFSLEVLLEEEDRHFLKATSGNEGLKLALNNEIALILLDVQMPGMDGYEVARVLKSNPQTKYIPIIFVTALSKDITNMLQGYEVGAIDYLLKPLEPVITKAKVDSFVRAYKLQRELDAAREAERRHLLAIRAGEERYAQIVDTAPDAVIVLDEVGRINEWNDQAEQIFGWKENEVEGKKLSELIIPEHYTQTYRTKVTELIKSGVTSRINEIKELVGLRKNTSEFPMELKMSSSRINNNPVLVCFIRDITERKKAEEERSRITALEQKNKELENFTYILSHDLKTPLRGLASLSEWIIRDYTDKLDEAGKEYLGLMKDRVSRLERLIDGVLKFTTASKMESAEMELVDCNQMIIEISKLVSLPNVAIKTDNNLPSVKYVKPSLMQVFQNLIDNAIKHNDKELIQINIGSTDDVDHWTFYVKDNGPGIAPQYHAKIFMIFQTLKTKDESNDTGIGLAVVKRVIETAGGKIWVESEEGKGASFFFTIPKL